MDYLRRAGWCRRRVRARAVWCVSAVFTAWIVLWRNPGDSLSYVMILMFMLASAGTLTLSTKMGDYEEEQAKQAAASPRFDQMLGAVHDMADALTSAREDDSVLDEALPTDAPRLRLIRSAAGMDLETKSKADWTERGNGPDP